MPAENSMWYVSEISSPRDFEGYVLQRLDVLENREREEEKKCRKRCKDSQRPIKAAVEFLTRTAVDTFGKMMFVVLAHLRRDS